MQTPIKPIQKLINCRPLLAMNSASKARPWPAVTLIVSSVLLFVSAAFIPAQQPLSLADADARAENLFQQSGVTGMVLVVVRNHEVMIKTYGETFPGSGRAPQANAFIRLCSISKVFTADLLLKLVADGKVSLNDPLQRYAPPGTIVPQAADGTPITLLDLATHTAGLTREVSSYPRKTPHFTFPDQAYRWNWLPTQTLSSTPGTAALYSNVGFDLLGDALASAAHTSYATLLHDRLLQPLNMWDTTLVPSSEQCSRLMQGTGNEGPCTDTQPSGPSGGIYSTPTDMVKLLQYLLKITGQPSPPAANLAVYVNPQQLKSIYGLSHAGDPTGMGLAWMQLGDPATPSAVLEKTGGGAGFETYIALNPSRQTGVFLAATDGKGDAQVGFFQEANNLLAALANVAPLPPRVHKARPAKRHPKAQRQTHSQIRPKKRAARPAPRPTQ
jgi:D-alanyl-D-alanine-carboxypeptidase/D-alanyl-D-alanine-endopeptidase